MNEIARIHIAKTAYDIEIAAKKQLEKYIKSLETYTQDVDVLADIEIRITELLAEHGVLAGGVITSADVKAVRSQLGEPYEFADGEGDIAVGPSVESSGRRYYRSTDNAVLGGVLSGIAAYFNVNPLWPRLVFTLFLFISFGFAAIVYVLFWILAPAARTATEKLQLAGKDVTLESIKTLNADEEKAPDNRIAPVVQRVLSIGLGLLSALAAVGVLVVAVWSILSVTILGKTLSSSFYGSFNGYLDITRERAFDVWLPFWIIIFGLLLLASLFGLIAYAFFARKLTKRMAISGAIIIVLGIASVVTVVSISATQSWRIANEVQSSVRETKLNLPKEFGQVSSLTIAHKTTKWQSETQPNYSQHPIIRYVVDEGPARYELRALPTTKVVTKTEAAAATITLEVPDGYQNWFAQPMLTVYGPALSQLTIDKSAADSKHFLQVSYASLGQPVLTIDNSGSDTSIQTEGPFERVIVQNIGTVDLSMSTIGTLEVQAKQGLTVSAGTVRDLIVTQPDVCSRGSSMYSTNVTVSGITSDTMTYNGRTLPAGNHHTGCASVTIEPEYSPYGEVHGDLRYNKMNIQE